MGRQAVSGAVKPLLAWDITVPLLANSFVLLDFVRWMLLIYAAMALIAGLIGLFALDMKVFRDVLQLFARICAGMAVLFVLKTIRASSPGREGRSSTSSTPRNLLAKRP
ncbi:hypothetical protein [Solidesulfovibrio sp.]